MMLQAAIERGEAQGEDDKGLELLKQMSEAMEDQEMQEGTPDIQDEELPMQTEDKAMPVPEGEGLMSREVV